MRSRPLYSCRPRFCDGRTRDASVTSSSSAHASALRARRRTAAAHRHPVSGTELTAICPMPHGIRGDPSMGVTPVSRRGITDWDSSPT
jgi:hypothetical protein